MADDVSPQRPLPECLTRFVTEPPRPPTPRLQQHPLEPPRQRRADEPAAERSSSSRRALQIALLWALGYNVFGFAIIVLLWRSLH